MKWISIALLGVALTAAGRIQAKPAAPVTFKLDTGHMYYYLLQIRSDDGNEVVMPAVSVAADGQKTYTVITGKEWTCTPTSANNSSATITCVKSDNPAPSAGK